MNSYFKFKQFTIQQDKCAMKVCTDSCLFGATVVQFIQEQKFEVKKVLDIGTGTGLLSLMLAQKFPIKIDAIEIDEAAYYQAKQNVADVTFQNQIQVLHQDILNFNEENKYDFIITNPPFFENQLKASQVGRNVAMHATSLSYIQLIQSIKKHLSANGIAAILLPYNAADYFEKLLEAKKLFLLQSISISHNPTKAYFRKIYFVSNIEVEKILTNGISIQDTTGNYTKAFTTLLKDYYLNL
jgi:tRNA1Val (adenine37-N6)-methyltransferase